MAKYKKCLNCSKPMKKVDTGNRFWYFWICPNDKCGMFKTPKEGLSEFKKPCK